MICISICTSVRYVYMYVCMYVYIYIYTYIHIYIYTYIHIYTCTYVVPPKGLQRLRQPGHVQSGAVEPNIITIIE